jgi:hypothetical protein
MTEIVAKPLSAQEEQYVMYRVRGLTPEAAAFHARLPNDTESIWAMHSANPAIDQYLLTMREEVRRQSIRAGVRVQFTRDDAALMYLEAHAKSANATEEIKAIDSLVNLFGLKEPEKKEVTVRGRAELQELSDKDLMDLAGQEILLDPSQYKRSDQ